MSRWAWVQLPGKAIDYAETERGFEVRLQRRLNTLEWLKSIQPFSYGPNLASGLLLCLALMAPLLMTGLILLYVLAMVLSQVMLWRFVNAQTHWDMEVRGGVLLVSDGLHEPWSAPLHKVSFDHVDGRILLEGPEGMLVLQTFHRREDLDFLKERIEESKTVHGTLDQVPESLRAVGRAAEAEGR